MVAAEMLGEGSAIGFISSAAGAAWAREDNMAWINEYLSHADMDDAAQWALDNGKADYFHSKLAVGMYVAREAYNFLKHGIRINAIMPGPTDTPLAQANKEMWLGFGADYREDLGIEASTPEEQAYPLVFLCSDAAKAITGITLTSDQGYFSSGITESFPAAKEMANFLTGRY
jgi:NAD(P)-dependent dehydrogenase (short-subunit alcohol dehydrogenase family)